MPRSEDRIGLTGNPFVDTGLASIAVMANLDDVQDLTVNAIRQVHGDGTRVSSWNGSLKSFTMVFTNNSLLTNPSVKDKNKRVRSYRDILDGLLKKIGNEELLERCEACGALRSVDFDPLCRNALAGVGIKEQVRFIGRDWFPLSGSLGSDAQALPVASRPVHLCARCLFAVHYLPLALILIDGRLAVFQSTSIEFWYELVRDIVSEVRSRIEAGSYDTLGAKEGSRAVAKRLLAFFQRLQTASHVTSIPRGTELQVWRFTNSGASPECETEQIPNPALVFLWKAVSHGLRSEIERLIDGKGRKERSFFRCIAERRDYSSLYPRGKRPGASPRLFALYQTEVCGRSPRVLSIAHTLSWKAAKGLTPQELKRLQREEAFSERALRNQFRGLMVRLASERKFTLHDYLGLFPLRDGISGIEVGFDGWNLIRYYLHHVDASGHFVDDSSTGAPPGPKLTTLRYYAARIFVDYIEERGKGRFQSEVLNRMARGEVGVAWLKSRFVYLAEKYVGFTYEAWQALCRSDRNQLLISEPLFQMRLLWIEWLGESDLPPVVGSEFPEGSGLPSVVERNLSNVFLQYAGKRGVKRFHQDVLVRLRRKEVGLEWFRRQLTREGKRDNAGLGVSEDSWDNFLRDEEGYPYAGERLFQMHLMAANAYRETKKSKKEEEF